MFFLPVLVLQSGIFILGLMVLAVQSTAGDPIYPNQHDCDIETCSALHSLRTPSSRPPYVYTEHATSLDLLEPHLQDCVDLALDLVSTSVRTLQRSMAHRLNVQDTPLIFQAAACDRDSSPISDYNPVAHAGHSEYEEFYF